MYLHQRVIALVGAESTGKTSLAIDLSKKYKALLVEEQARSYLQDIGLKYTTQDIYNIAKLQIEAEKRAITGDYPIIVLDTELITIALWLEFYGYDIPLWISDYIQDCHYEYVLLDTNIPWVADGLRNNPWDRSKITEMFRSKLDHYKKSYKVLTDIEGWTTL
jgi:nicotinamide riboside kinase